RVLNSAQQGDATREVALDDALREFGPQRTGAGDEATETPASRLRNFIAMHFSAHKGHRVNQDAMALAWNQRADRAERNLVRPQAKRCTGLLPHRLGRWREATTVHAARNNRDPLTGDS